MCISHHISISVFIQYVLIIYFDVEIWLPSIKCLKLWSLQNLFHFLKPMFKKNSDIVLQECTLSTVSFFYFDLRKSSSSIKEPNSDSISSQLTKTCYGRVTGNKQLLFRPEWWSTQWKLPPNPTSLATTLHTLKKGSWDSISHVRKLSLTSLLYLVILRY